MPGMLDTGPEMTWAQKFDAQVRAQAARDAQDAMREQQWRHEQGMLGRAGFARLLDLLQGGEPTREPLEQWMQRRKAPPPGRGMLDRIDGRMIPRRGPPRRPTPYGSTVRG